MTKSVVGTGISIAVIIVVFVVVAGVIPHMYNQNLKSEQNNLHYCEWLVSQIAGDKAAGRTNISIAELGLYQNSCSS